METDLHAVIRAGILQDIHRQYVIYQLLKSLHFLHTAELIHRDVKPSNSALRASCFPPAPRASPSLLPPTPPPSPPLAVLLNSDCHVKVCDFGLCRSVAEGTAASATSPVLTDYVATRWYRAPEILLGSTRYTKGVDMWAVGCILGEMLLGKPLFPGNSTMNQLERVLEVVGKPSPEDLAAARSPFAATMIDSLPALRARPLKDLFPGAHPDAVDLIMRCMTFNPDKRISAYEALRHRYVAAFHDAAEEKPCPKPLRIHVDDNVKYSAADYRDRLYREIARRKAAAKGEGGGGAGGAGAAATPPSGGSSGGGGGGGAASGSSSGSASGGSAAHKRAPSASGSGSTAAAAAAAAGAVRL